MKTILMTVSRGAIAYNLLHNDFYKKLREEHKFVILTSAFEDERFLCEFSHPNVTFRDFGETEQSFVERMVFFLHKHLIYNSTVNQKSRWGIIGDPRSKNPWLLGHWSRKVVFTPLSKVRLLRDLVRWFDYRFLQKKLVKEYSALLTEVQPDIVISTFVNGHSEAALIKAARLQKITSVGFPKSWDNLSKHGFRAKPNRVVVWNQFMKDQLVEFHNYRPEEVDIIGVPQFDAYVDESLLMSRTEFCQVYGLDPERKIILFGSEGKLFPTDANIASILADYVSDSKAQLLIRPHYGYKNDEQKFKDSLDREFVTVDLFNNPSENLRDGWDYSCEFAKRFINCLQHSDVLVNTASTLAIDAVACDTPVVCIAFDGETPLSYSESIARWYETYYYREVLSYGAVNVVSNKAELVETLETYLTNPKHKSEERAKMREAMTYKLDGQAGVRFASLINKYLG